MKDEKTNALMHMLIKCVTACEVCADACLQEEHVVHMAGCIRLDRDCADICTLTARMVARESAQAGDVLQLCIATCDACEKECAAHDNWHCRECAEVCAECRDACKAYAAEGAAA